MNPFLIRSPTIVANSGGKTSGFNLWKHLEANGGYRGLAVKARTELDLIPPDDFDNAITCEGGYCTD